jgi:hypothetical protein
MNEHPADAACAALGEVGKFAPLFVRDPISMSRLEAAAFPAWSACRPGISDATRRRFTHPAAMHATWIEEQRVARTAGNRVELVERRAGRGKAIRECGPVAGLRRAHRRARTISSRKRLDSAARFAVGSSGRDDDVAIAYRISDLLKSAASPVPHHLHVTCNAPEVKGLVGLVDLAVTGRMHSRSLRWAWPCRW